MSDVGLQKPQRPRILQVHHLKLAVSRIDISLVWYERVLGARRIPELDQLRSNGSRYVVVCELKEWSGLYVELRENSAQAARDREWSPITLLVAGCNDILAWTIWFDSWGTPHSSLLVGARGWILVFQDPDGRRFQMYTQDRHDGSLEMSTDDFWLPDA